MLLCQIGQTLPCCQHCRGPFHHLKIEQIKIDFIERKDSWSVFQVLAFMEIQGFKIRFAHKDLRHKIERW